MHPRLCLEEPCEAGFVFLCTWAAHPTVQRCSTPLEDFPLKTDFLAISKITSRKTTQIHVPLRRKKSPQLRMTGNPCLYPEVRLHRLFRGFTEISWFYGTSGHNGQFYNCRSGKWFTVGSLTRRGDIFEIRRKICRE